MQIVSYKRRDWYGTKYADQGYYSKKSNGNNLNVPKSLKAAAQKLYREYNQTMPDEGEKRSEILHQLFRECSDQNASIDSGENTGKLIKHIDCKPCL